LKKLSKKNNGVTKKLLCLPVSDVLKKVVKIILQTEYKLTTFASKSYCVIFL